MAVQPAPRIPRMRRSLNDFQGQLENLDFRMPMASAADKVGPMRVGAGGAAPQLCKTLCPRPAGNRRRSVQLGCRGGHTGTWITSPTARLRIIALPSVGSNGKWPITGKSR